MPDRTVQSRLTDYIFIRTITGLLVLAVILPLIVIALASFVNIPFLGVPSEQWLGPASRWLNLQWFGYVINLYGGTLLFSLRLAVLSIILSVGIGVPAAYGLVRYPFPGSRWLEDLVLLPLSIPGIAVSIALIQGYSRMRGYWGLILAGHLLYTLPFMIRTVTSSLRTLDWSTMDAAAQTLGASLAQRFFLVILPQLRHAIMIGSMLVFAISWGEFNVSYLLNTPIHQTYPAALFATYTSNSLQVSSAATVIFLLGILPPLFGIQWLGASRTDVMEQGA